MKDSNIIKEKIYNLNYFSLIKYMKFIQKKIKKYVKKENGNKNLNLFQRKINIMEIKRI